MSRTLASLLLLGSVAAASHATVLNFDIPGLSNGALMPQSYGDNVAFFVDGPLVYGSAGGLTPNVTVDYVGSDPGQTDLNFWSTGYNDLTNVLEYEPDGAVGYSVVFTASTGFVVTLDSFDLGNFGGAVTLPEIRVTNELGATIYSETNVAVPTSNAPHISFAPGVTGSSLTLLIDTTGLGGGTDNIGLVNIQFSQAVNPVPEPATFAALGLGLAALLRRRRK